VVHAGGGEDGLPDGWLRYVVPTDDSTGTLARASCLGSDPAAADEEPLPESEYEREEREKESGSIGRRRTNGASLYSL